MYYSDDYIEQLILTWKPPPWSKALVKRIIPIVGGLPPAWYLGPPECRYRSGGLLNPVSGTQCDNLATWWSPLGQAVCDHHLNHLQVKSCYEEWLRIKLACVLYYKAPELYVHIPNLMVSQAK